MAKTTKAGYEKAVAGGTVGKARKRYLGLGFPLSNYSSYFLLILVSSLVSSFYSCSYSKEALRGEKGVLCGWGGVVNPLNSALQGYHNILSLNAPLR